MATPLIHPEISRAHTLPSRYYTCPEYYRRQVEGPLARGWHFLEGAAALPAEGDALPLVLLPGCLDEPLALVQSPRGLEVLANVCPHRGNLVVTEPCRRRELRCDYHGRRFSLEGRMLSMPEFQDCQDFPGPGDSLARVPSGLWEGLVFASADPESPFEDFLAPVRDRLPWVPFERMELDPATCRDYEFDGHWALYVDNYLEGFHVPYVHPGLARVLDYGAYRTELLPSGTLQVGIGKEGESCLEPPGGHPDHGQRVAGYYFWLFPTTMVNVYPWGMSLNAVQPRGPGRTRVHFRSYVWDASLQEEGAGGDLETVELEDEAVVETVQLGVRSRFYDRGRYSPTQERGVHHFHRLLAASLGEG